MTDLNLVVAIQNALARNEGMDSAIESLVNAGYSREDISEAAGQVQISTQPQIQLPLATSPQKEASPRSGKIILLIVFLSLLALGILAYLLIKVM